MSPYVRPGPSSVPPGGAPGGLVLLVYSVPAQVLLLTRYLPASLIETGGMAALAEADAAALEGHEAVCVVVYDGDSGRRMDYPPGTTLEDLDP